MDQVWAGYDENGDGVLDAEELADMIHTVMKWDGDESDPDKPSIAEASRFISSMDKDGDGLLSKAEFLSFITSAIAMDDKQRMLFAERSTMHAKLMLFTSNILNQSSAPPPQQA